MQRGLTHRTGQRAEYTLPKAELALLKIAFKSELFGKGCYALLFKSGDPPVKGRFCTRQGGKLTHDRKKGSSFPEQFSQPFESGKAFLAPGGKNQMPYKHSFLKHPSPVEDRISHLPVHFQRAASATLS